MESESQELRRISRAEVAEHNTENDCWIIYDEKVYDVTQLLQKHPGGSESIMQVAGQDATSVFNDQNHSETARRNLEQYLIGCLEIPSL